MSNDTTPETPAVTIDAEVKKPKKLSRLTSKLPTRRQIATGAALFGAGALAVVFGQKRTGQTVDFQVTTPEIDYDAGTSEPVAD